MKLKQSKNLKRNLLKSSLKSLKKMHLILECRAMRAVLSKKLRPKIKVKKPQMSQSTWSMFSYLIRQRIMLHLQSPVPMTSVETQHSHFRLKMLGSRA